MHDLNIKDTELRGLREQLNELRIAQLPAAEQQAGAGGALEGSVLRSDSETPPPGQSSTRVPVGDPSVQQQVSATPSSASASVRSSLMRRVLQSGRKYVDSTLSALTSDLAVQQQQLQTQSQAAIGRTSSNGGAPPPPPGETEALQQSSERVAELEREMASLQQYNAQWAQAYAALEAQCRSLVRLTSLNYYSIINTYTTHEYSLLNLQQMYCFRIRVPYFFNNVFQSLFTYYSVDRKSSRARSFQSQFSK